jgi:hypothetical protein
MNATMQTYKKKVRRVRGWLKSKEAFTHLRRNILWSVFGLEGLRSDDISNTEGHEHNGVHSDFLGMATNCNAQSDANTATRWLNLQFAVIQL